MSSNTSGVSGVRPSSSPTTSYASFFDSPIWLQPTPPHLTLPEYIPPKNEMPENHQPKRSRSSTNIFLRPGSTGSMIFVTASENLKGLARRRSLNLPRRNSFTFTQHTLRVGPGKDKSPAPSFMTAASRSKLSLAPSEATTRATTTASATTTSIIIDEGDAASTSTSIPPPPPQTPQVPQVQELMDSWGGFGDFALDMPSYTEPSPASSSDLLSGLEVVVKQVKELEKVEEEEESNSPLPRPLSLSLKRKSGFDDVVEYIDGELRRIETRNVDSDVRSRLRASRSSGSHVSSVSTGSGSGESCSCEEAEVSVVVAVPCVPPRSPLRAVPITQDAVASQVAVVQQAPSADTPYVPAFTPGSGLALTPTITHTASAPLTRVATPSTIIQSTAGPTHIPTVATGYGVKRLSMKRPSTAGGHERSGVTRRFSTVPMRNVQFRSSTTGVNLTPPETEATVTPAPAAGGHKWKALLSKIKKIGFLGWRGKKNKGSNVVV
ncbi:hypothetical protein VNI00_009823 [Paramarasmius palmivorus]|uniref:Uncharacterized protein n=1 Tax=Paramarasmius palmivorus TaxID=297713 RepID=A0AAW0CNF5_9AGAR